MHQRSAKVVADDRVFPNVPAHCLGQHTLCTFCKRGSVIYLTIKHVWLQGCPAPWLKEHFSVPEVCAKHTLFCRAAPAPSRQTSGIPFLSRLASSIPDSGRALDGGFPTTAINGGGGSGNLRGFLSQRSGVLGQEPRIRPSSAGRIRGVPPAGGSCHTTLWRYVRQVVHKSCV
jgi:hypothetical protein